MREKSMAYIQISELVLSSFNTLEEFILSLQSVEGGFKTLPNEIVKIYEVNNFNGFSGYNYWIDNEMVGQLHLSSLKNGWYCIHKRIFFENQLNETFSFYDSKGIFSHESTVFDGQSEIYESEEMDATSPIVNHLYNILAQEYENTLNAQANSIRMNLFESILKALYENNECKIGANSYTKDAVYNAIKKSILRFEKEKVLKWTERQNIFKNLLEKREKILKTKKRAHSFSSLTYTLPFFFADLLLKLELIKSRPVNNMKGILYKYTLGNLIWFLKTVKDNLGYSIALAIYGPFTYYFITQPMNPHAMWVVGEVREAYIATSEKLESFFSDGKEDKTKQVQDQVSTKLAAVSKDAKWLKRMSNFKAMHIAHESNLIFSERMGRLEMIETQLNFPLAVEGAWNEIIRYKRAVDITLTYTKNLDTDYKAFLKGELKRAKDAQVYLWERMGQFFIDYPYILVDQSLEQTQKDNYTGRAFVFMQKMTNELSKDKTLIPPKTHDKITALAKFYTENKKEAATITEKLQKNSRLFAENDIFNTDRFRAYMKRHWEILFLQQNKKQEAASFGMQAYSASIKNAIWTIQSLYSAKRDDHMVLSYKFNLDNQNTESSMPYQETNEIIENLLHFITFDYVSIKKEFSQNLKNDKEAFLRERLINNIKNYVSQRDTLLQKNQKVFVKTVTNSEN